MRTSAKLITALSVAALVGVAGSAFTASNTVPDEVVSGYGESEAVGAAISAMTKTLVSTDQSRLARVVFTSTDDVTGNQAWMTLKDGDDPIHAGAYECDLGTYDITMTITCDIPAGQYPLLSAFDTTGLTVTDLTVTP